MIKQVSLRIGSSKQGLLYPTLFKNTFFIFLLLNGFIDKVLKPRKRKVTVTIVLQGKSERVLLLVSGLSQVLYRFPASHAVALRVLS